MSSDERKEITRNSITLVLWARTAMSTGELKAEWDLVDDNTIFISFFACFTAITETLVSFPVKLWES